MTPEDHSSGPVHCDQLGPFVDGELGAVEAAGFRRHLVQCARCQQEMHGLMQLSALAEGARVQPAVPGAERAPVPVAAADRRVRPRRAAWMGVVGAVAIAAALVLALRGPTRRGRTFPTLLASLDARTVSGWPSAAGAAQYKPYQTMRGTGPVPIPPRSPRPSSGSRGAMTGGRSARWPCSGATSPRRTRTSRGCRRRRTCSPTEGSSGSRSSATPRRSSTSTRR